METRRLGPLDVTVAGVGCNNFGRRIGEDGARDVVRAALDADVRFFDTADVYGDGESEVLLGRALGAGRPRVVIATKFGYPVRGQSAGARPDYVRRAIDASLHRLGSDHVDLYQLHVPDPSVPIGETLGALDELVVAGKVRAVGCSNFDGALIAEADGAAATRGTTRFVSAQNHYSLLEREVEADVVPACRRSGLGLLPYYPLEAGLLTGKVVGGTPPPGTRLAARPELAARRLTARNLALVERLERFAADRGRTLLELALGWLAAQDVVASVIAGASDGAQVRANAAACASRLSDADVADISALTATA